MEKAIINDVINTFILSVSTGMRKEYLKIFKFS